MRLLLVRGTPAVSTRPLVAGSVVVGAAYSVVLLGACIACGYGCGSWFGKSLAAAFGMDRGSWGDWGGIYGGLAGVGVAVGVLIARFM